MGLGATLNLAFIIGIVWIVFMILAPICIVIGIIGIVKLSIQTEPDFVTFSCFMYHVLVEVPLKFHMADMSKSTRVAVVSGSTPFVPGISTTIGESWSATG